ncbi:Uncharacterised protein (plasmid) [Tsukamurella tyrosinosolvens]|uniref:Uncharacterized protein n=1 Tax=Tsukamurella tyrosinosolvens TaxID=57704 RepID=A0A1H4UFP7_TSUTY|nr:hypothetical protein [Tsukamurella tyrosinosolvens]KXO92931.1 hypothetical protein AXK58_13755 [Tsukamurella tyrosinosolvens]SEC67557.1 hypothetical protein SAMN04489793_2886 [Tsukamurella tyrosinosolvens]VEH94193.1 Uncharacterised protein [Tsukamurella tyrosinosolvens]
MYRLRFVGDDVTALTGFLCHLPDDVFTGQYGNTAIESEAATFASEDDVQVALGTVRRLFDPDQEFVLEVACAGGWTPLEVLS